MKTLNNHTRNGFDVVVKVLGDVVQYPICLGVRFQTYTTIVATGFIRVIFLQSQFAGNGTLFQKSEILYHTTHYNKIDF